MPKFVSQNETVIFLFVAHVDEKHRRVRSRTWYVTADLANRDWLLTAGLKRFAGNSKAPGKKILALG